MSDERSLDFRIKKKGGQPLILQHRFAHRVFLDLAGRAAGKAGFAEADALGRLVAGDALAAEGGQLLEAGLGGADLAHHHGVNPLAPDRIGDADDGAFLDRRVPGQGVLDLDRIDVLGPGYDHVLQPVGDVDIAVLVHPPRVAGVQPAVAHDFGGFFRAVPVALHDVVATADDLADLSARDLVSGFVNDADFKARRHLAAGAQARVVVGALVVLGRQHGDGGHFGLAEALDEADVREFLARQGQGGGGQGRAAVAQHLQLRQIQLIQPIILGHAVDDGGHGEAVRHAVLGDGLQHGFGVVAAAKDVGRPGHGGEQNADVRQMEHGRGVEIDPRLVERDGHQQVRGDGVQIAVAEHHPLGQAGGAAGVENARQVAISGQVLLGRFGSLDQAFMRQVRGRARRPVQGDQALDRALGQKLFGDGGELLAEAQNLDARVSQLESQFRRGQPGVQRCQHAPGPEHGEIGFEIEVAVVGQDGDPVAGLQPGLFVQAASQAGDAIADLAPGAATLAVDGGGAARGRDDGADEALGDSHRKGCSGRPERRKECQIY
uniref:Transcriptional regulator n=1 Tax=Parastrongyloides trichosuri TaxID=131310 RepID=A0A0N4Z3R4_PARTI